MTTHHEAIRIEFGRNVAAERARLGLTQQELASRSGIGRDYISRVETGKASPSLPTVIALARALEVGVSTLINEEEWFGE